MGFGTSPFGLTPFGWGSPALAPAPSGRALDLGDGRQSGSRSINPITRTYDFAANGRVLGMSDTRQLVLIAILNKVSVDVTEIAPDFERRVANAYRAAVDYLVKARKVAIIAITVTPRGQAGSTNANGVDVRFRWRDLVDPLQPVHEEHY